MNLLSIGQASEYLGVSIDTLRRWEKKGKITSYRSPGGHRYFKKNELDDMFGKKYERTPETKPRKEYETQEKEFVTPIEPQKLEIKSETIVIETQDAGGEQEVVDAIISEDQKDEAEIENIFSRETKNITIPKLEPIKIVSQPVANFTSAAVQTPYNQIASAAPEPKLFTSFSQLPQEQKKVVTVKNPINQRFLLITVAAVVVVVAIIFIVIYFATKPTLISPI